MKIMDNSIETRPINNQDTSLDSIVNHIAETYGISPNKIKPIISEGQFGHFADRLRLAEQAAIMKKDFPMPAYSRNVELIQKYGYKELITIAESAMEKQVDVYNLDRTIESLRLEGMREIGQIIPLAEEAADTLKIYSDSHTFYKTFDKEGRLHFFLYANVILI